MQKNYYVVFTEPGRVRYLTYNLTLTGAYSEARRFHSTSSASEYVRRFLRTLRNDGDWRQDDIKIIEVTERSIDLPQT